MQVLEKDDRIIINWLTDNTSDTFFYAWLRDNTPKNRHKNGQKLTESITIDLESRPKSIKTTENSLWIEWDNGTVEYSYSYLKNMLSKKEYKTTLWSQLSEYSIFDYQTIISDQKILLECLKNIREYGFTQITNVPTETKKLLEVVALFGYVRETNYGKYYDVIAKNDPENLADTQLGLPPHTDNPYRNPTPTIQLLHCLKSDTTGGETILIDGFNVATKLRENYPEYFEVLSRYLVQFEFKSSEHWLKNEAPIIQLDLQKNIEKIKFNNRSIQPFNFSDDIMLTYYKAYQYFENQLQNRDNQLQFKLNPSDLIIYDNERILHGRTSYSLHGERHLQGCYTDKDALYSKINILEQDV
ncbi:TauD/TfdA family dioxygenase [Aquimarina longa]|uniref:TauD/TfdA family dioxygenase n=1 Tax=Aquimarina longa TaxID=1080221 RepID=UPI000A4C68D6|nr:TauD/TfdA family dioxygenase [Aquimarina longa]